MSSSFNVPKPPPMAIKLSGARTLMTFRTVPNPVVIATVKYGLHSPRSSPGAMPTTIPPNERAPFEAAFITPLIPPETQIAPERAISRPTSSAHWIEFVGTASVVAAVPSTPIMGTRILNLFFFLELRGLAHARTRVSALLISSRHLCFKPIESLLRGAAFDVKQLERAKALDGERRGNRPVERSSNQIASLAPAD